MTARSDIHRVSAIVPADYKPLFAYATPGIYGDPGFNMGLLRAVRTGEPAEEIVWAFNHNTGRVDNIERRTVTSPWGKVAFFRNGGSGGQCDCCGAHFRYGEVWRHVATGVGVHIGNICADKLQLWMDVTPLDRHKERVAKLSEAFRARRERIAGFRVWARSNRDILPLLHGTHHITQDIRRRLISSGAHWGLSTKQVDLLRRLSAPVVVRPPEQKSVVPVSTERVTVHGVVQSVKSVEGAMGRSVLKMTLRCTAPDGGIFRLWGTVPGCLLTNDLHDGLVGKLVEFEAMIQRSDRDPSFAFFKRPTKARLA